MRRVTKYSARARFFGGRYASPGLVRSLARVRAWDGRAALALAGGTLVAAIGAAPRPLAPLRSGRGTAPALPGRLRALRSWRFLSACGALVVGRAVPSFVPVVGRCLVFRLAVRFVGLVWLAALVASSGLLLVAVAVGAPAGVVVPLSVLLSGVVSVPCFVLLLAFLGSLAVRALSLPALPPCWSAGVPGEVGAPVVVPPCFSRVSRGSLPSVVLPPGWSR